MIIPYRGKTQVIAPTAFVAPTAVLIGMNAVILHGATIGENARIAAGAVVTEEMVVPPHTLAAGVPANVKKELDGSSRQWVDGSAAVYRQLAREYRQAMEPHAP